MGKNISLNEKVKKKLLHVFENLKDDYVPNSADGVLIGLKIKDAIEKNTLTTDNLLELKKCEKYNKIVNILRAANLNLDLSIFENK